MSTQLKSKKKVIIAAIAAIITIVVSFIIYSAFVFRTFDPVNAFGTWKSVVIDNNEIYVIQEGDYSGGDPDIPMEGYVFVSYDLSTVDAMEKMGFHDIGHIYSSPEGKKQTEYCTSEAGLHSIIEGRLFYFGGYRLKYCIVGVC